MQVAEHAAEVRVHLGGGADGEHRAVQRREPEPLADEVEALLEAQRRAVGAEPHGELVADVQAAIGIGRVRVRRRDGLHGRAHAVEDRRQFDPVVVVAHRRTVDRAPDRHKRARRHAPERLPGRPAAAGRWSIDCGAMRAATIRDGKVFVEQHPDPEPGAGQVLVRVHGAGLNGADMMQLAGRYPAPPGSPQDIPGLELAGVVEALGPGATRFAEGDRVMGIVGGGGQAELAVVHERQLMAVPDGVGFPDAGGLPEVFTTAHDAVFTQAALRPGERLLINGAAGGVGTAAIQLAHAAGAHVTASVRNTDAHAAARRSAPTSSSSPRASRSAARSTSCSSSSARRTSRATSRRSRPTAGSSSSASRRARRPRSTSWR